MFAAPFAYLAWRNAADLGGFIDALSTSRTLAPLARSLALATTVSLLTAIIGTGSAWLVQRTDLPGRRLLRVVLPLPLVLPSFIGAFALIAALAPGGLAEQLLSPLGVGAPDIRGFLGATLVLTVLSYPYVYLPVAARLTQLPPSLEEAARLFGRRPLEVFREIVLPQIRSAILAGTLLVFLYAISDFGAVTLMGFETLTPAIYATRLFDQTTSLALSLQLGVLALLVVVLERIGLGSKEARTERGAVPLTLQLGRWKPWAMTGVYGVLAVSLALPGAVLVYWAVRGIVRGSTRASAVVADLSSLVEPAINTAVVSITAAVVTVVVVLPVAFLSGRYRSRLGQAANAFVVAGFALPGLALALALVVWALKAPGPLRGLYQTQTLLVFAYVIHFGAQALRSAEVAVNSVPRRLGDAARVLGAARWRRLFTVELPLMLPGLLAGGGLVLLSSMKELPATLLLAPPGFETLATKIWNATEDAYLADASIASLVLIALSGVLTWVLVVRRSEGLR